MPFQPFSYLNPINLKTQTSTPPVVPPSPVNIPFSGIVKNPASSPGAAASNFTSMGVKAAQPQNNIGTPTNTIPTSKTVAAPATNTGWPNTTGSSNTASVSNAPWPGGTSAPTTSTATPQPQNGLYGQLINQLANFGLSPEQQRAYALQANLETGLSAGNNAIMNKAIPLEFQQGQMAALQRDYGPQLTAANKSLELANTQRGLQLQGLTSAAGLAQPQQMPFTSQLINPINGANVGAGGGNPITAQIPDYAQKVASGQMTFDDASSALGGNPIFTGQLNQAIKSINPNFNVSASNVLGGQSYQTLINSFNTVNQHLGDLTKSVKNLPLTDFPIINNAINGVSSAVGSKAFQDYKTKIAAVRAEIANVLGGGQATDMARMEAESLLPDNLGPNQLDAAIKAAQQLMQEKINSYGSLGGGQTTVQGAPGANAANSESVGWF